MAPRLLMTGPWKDQNRLTMLETGAAHSGPSLAASSVEGSGDLVSIVLAALDDAKAEDVVTIDLAGKSSLADAMVIASGRSHRHVAAVADQLEQAVKKAGALPRTEGLPHADWVLVDAGDVIIHIFRPEVRSFYNIEKMWGLEAPEHGHA